MADLRDHISTNESKPIICVIRISASLPKRSTHIQAETVTGGSFDPHMSTAGAAGLHTGPALAVVGLVVIANVNLPLL